MYILYIQCMGEDPPAYSDRETYSCGKKMTSQWLHKKGARILSPRHIFLERA